MYSQDYIVTAKGDTLKGEVKPVTYGLNPNVQFKDVNKKKTIYPIVQVKAFFYKKEIYHSVKGPNGYAFMKLKKAGYLSLYAFQLPNQMMFDGQYLTKLDGTGIEVPNLGFKKFMTPYLSECTAVSEKIDKGTFGKRDLNEIIDEFNACIENRTADYSKQLSEKEVQTKKANSWDSLEKKIKALPDFEGKSNALDMITEVKGKISRGEKVPNFLTEGLKNILNPTELKADLENAMQELN